jgi:phenylalanine-4-hydroxylase
VFSIDSDSPNRIAFDLERIMQTDFIISDFQETYWVIDDIQQLFDATKPDFKPIYQALEPLPEYAPGDVLETDDVLHHGSGKYHQEKRKAASA